MKRKLSDRQVPQNTFIFQDLLANERPPGNKHDIIFELLTRNFRIILDMRCEFVSQSFSLRNVYMIISKQERHIVNISRHNNLGSKTDSTMRESIVQPTLCPIRGDRGGAERNGTSPCSPGNVPAIARAFLTVHRARNTIFFCVTSATIFSSNQNILSTP